MEEGNADVKMRSGKKSYSGSVKELGKITNNKIGSCGMRE